MYNNTPIIISVIINNNINLYSKHWFTIKKIFKIILQKSKNHEYIYIHAISLCTLKESKLGFGINF